MRTHQTIKERLSIDASVNAHALATTDTEEQTTAPDAWVDMQGYQRVLGIGNCGESGANGSKFKVQLRQAKDSAGDGAKDLGDEVVVDMDDGDTGFATVEASVNDLDLDNDFRYVGVQIAYDPGSEDSVDASAEIIRADGSYRP